jgi:hypothetical protein
VDAVEVGGDVVVVTDGLVTGEFVTREFLI